MAADGSDCLEHFGYGDFKVGSGDGGNPDVCPVEGCSSKLDSISYRKGERAFCPVHGIRLHSNTFVYWNGEDRKDEARLRNFRIRPDLAREIALNSVGKAESYRLGYEMSEDALTWNVFVGFAHAGKLRRAVKFLTGRDVDTEPALYLWGELVDIAGSKRQRYQPLNDVRDMLEKGIRYFKTEPDVILVLDGKFVICIEAKFSSGNTLAHEAATKDGHKPADRQGLLQRYLDPAPLETRRIIRRDGIGEMFHSQLFRNVIFASSMAKGCDWHVVNLVSDTQWKSGKSSKQYSFVNPEGSVQSYLHPDRQSSFTFRTWEALHGALIKDEPDLSQLDTYFYSKSAHYRKAFDLE